MLLDMFVEYLKSEIDRIHPRVEVPMRVNPNKTCQDIIALRLIMLSGDWIPLKLPQAFWSLHPCGAQCRVYSLGGATEVLILLFSFKTSD